MKQLIKRSFPLLLLCAILLLGVLPTATDAAEIASGTCGTELTWVLDDAGTLTISGSGDMTDFAAASESPWYSSRASIKKIVIGDGVTIIGDRAFYGCTALGDVTIGNSVTTIGTYAFRGCSAMTEVMIPANVTQLEDSAFRACTALSTVTFCGNAPTIGNYVFNDGSGTLTILYYEGATGFDAEPWTSYMQKAPLHVGVWIVDKEPTCTEDGSSHIDCTYCEETIVEVLPSGGHNYEDGFCTICQELQIIDSGNCGDNVTWELDGAGNLIISGTGDMYSYSSNDIPWYGYREKIASVRIDDGVTCIGSSAFYDCSGLTSVTIPGSVTSIGRAAFYNCSALTSVTIGNGVTGIGGYAFYGCSALTSITIPDSVISIDYQAFRGCSALTSITIPDRVTSISSYMFAGCSALTSVAIPDSVTFIGDDVFRWCGALTDVYITDIAAWFNTDFSGDYSNPLRANDLSKKLYLNGELLTDLVIPDGVTGIGNYAFYRCNGLTSVTIPDSVTDIGDRAFYGCSGLTSVTIPDSVTGIGSGAFFGCSGLASVTIPESVTGIGSGAFSGCSGLTNVTIPESVTSIESSAFEDCSGLTSVTIPESVTSIGDYAFSGCSGLTSVTIPDSVTSIGSSAFSDCSGLTSVTIPDSVTSIGGYAFSDCDGLICVTIPESVSSIGREAFEGCSSLTSVTIPDSVTSIGDSAFSGCSALTSVTIGSGVTNIDPNAFYGCSSLASVTIESGVTSIGDSMFYNCSALTNITIPDSVTSIGDSTFFGCSSLTSVTVGSGVTSIDNDAFYGCSALTDVYLTDITAWLNINIYGYNSNPLCANGLNKKLYLKEALLTDLVIPDGVTDIGDYAFYSCSALTNVTIPDSVTSIESCAFKDCSALTSVTIGNGVTSIEFSAFEDCSALTSVTIGNGVTDISGYAFYGCSALMSITIPDSVTSIGNWAFYNCSSLTSVTIPDSVTSIGVSAFHSCSGLTSVSIGSGVTNISHSAFYNCSSLTNVSIGSGVTSISGDAFYRCSSLTSVTIPDSVTSIGEYAFYNCSSLTSVTIPDSVTSIGYDAFDERNIRDIYYGGTETNWQSLSYPPYAERIHYSCTTPDNHWKSESADATCTESGYTRESCVCGHERNKVTTDALGHEMGEWILGEDGLERSDCSRCDYFETREPEVTELLAPTIKVSNVASSGKPKLSWAKVEGAAKYEVYRSTSKNGTYKWLATTTGTSQINKNAETGKLYYYKVRAVSASGTKSEWSNIVSRTSDLARPVVKISNDAATGKPKLTWNAVEGATKYMIYRSISKTGTYSWLATTTNTNQINKNAVAGTQYFYKVRAIHSNTNANSAYSTIVSTTCDLARPTVKVTNDAATGKPKLTWNAVEGATKYQVYRSTDGENWSWLANVTGTSQINKNAVAGTKYYYKVRAVHSKSAANSAYSSVVSSTCDLPRPTLTVTLNSSGKPKLSWNAIEGATKYQVYRSTDGKNWEWLATVTGTTQTNKNAVAGTTYYYRVRAIHSNSAANSAYSSYKYITAK